ncbi:MAG: PIN domain-containing protein, partial [Brachybacterium sp.]|nr:PIN domain-containing protein [Brachybacterium sp.]
MEETTTAHATMPATDGTASLSNRTAAAVIGAANPDGAPVVPSLLPGVAQQMLAEVETGVITYVLDTSVLLSDPQSLHRFAEHDIVLPIVVITELEAKRHHPDLGYFARQALRILDDLREQHGNLAQPL